MNEKKSKVRALGRPEMEHLAGFIRESVVVLHNKRLEVQIPLARQTTDILAEALEEFAKTVTEP